MENQEPLDYESMKELALKQLRSGQHLTGKGGAFAPLLKQFLEAALEAELEDHLKEEKAGESPDRKNGKVSKTVKTQDGAFTLETSRDRNGNFDPQLIKKRETILADSLQDKILGLYGLGMSLRDISGHIEEMYDMKVSHDTLSTVIDRVVPMIKEWQSRPLDEVYCIVWLDAMYYKIREDGRVRTRVLYNILGVNVEGRKEILGMYICESEGAHFWLSVLTDLQNRGVKDILIACIDNLNGFAEAINTIFPYTEVQSCIVHQVRNSLKYVASKDKKAFTKDLKAVYTATGQEIAYQELMGLSETWGRKYPAVIASWERNWEKLTTYFKYSQPIRTLIYTTNPIEGYHRQIRKVTKTKGAFPSDMALLKVVFLAQRKIVKNWDRPLHNWGEIVSQLDITFRNRLKLMN